MAVAAAVWLPPLRPTTRGFCVALATGPGRPEEPLLVRHRSLVVMLMAACLSLFGFTMPAPILPLLRDEFGLSATQVGLVSSSFALGMLFAVMFLPVISDRRGRRPVAAGALGCTAAGFLAQGLVLRLRLRLTFGFQWFLLARFATGLFAGCNPIFKAYLADVVPAARLPRFMVYREASATVAFVLGPTLGGFLASSRTGPAGPFYATAAAHLVAACLVATCMEESIGLARAADPTSSSEESGHGMLVVTVFAMSFVYVIGQSCFSSFFALLMNDRFGKSPQDIGVLCTMFSLVALTFQLLFYGPMERCLGVCRTGALGAAGIGLGLAGLGIEAVPLLVASTLYAVGVASFPATIPTLLASAVPRSRRGFVLGIDSVVNNVCRIFAPFFLGTLYARSSGLCFQAAGSLMFTVVVMLLLLARTKRLCKR